jgi:hypothetical protein
MDAIAALTPPTLPPLEAFLEPLFAPLPCFFAPSLPFLTPLFLRPLEPILIGKLRLGLRECGDRREHDGHGEDQSGMP